MFADVRRGLTIAAVVHGATVKDSDGNDVDTDEFFGPPAAAEGAEEALAAGAEDDTAGGSDVSDAEGADDDK
jgi:trigger factor